MAMDPHAGAEVDEAGARLEDEGEGEVIGGRARASHGGVHAHGIGHVVCGDEAADGGVVMEEVGRGWGGEEKA